MEVSFKMKWIHLPDLPAACLDCLILCTSNITSKGDLGNKNASTIDTVLAFYISEAEEGN